MESRDPDTVLVRMANPTTLCWATTWAILHGILQGRSRAPGPMCHLHGPHLSVKAPPLQGPRRRLPRKTRGREMPGQERRPREARPSRAPLHPSHTQPRCQACLGGDEAQAMGAGRRLGFVLCPHQQGQSVCVIKPAQGCPVTLGWDQDTGARPLCPPLSAPSLKAHKETRSQQYDL